MNAYPKSGKTTYHRDGSATYWSVYDQQWQRTRDVPDRELAGMDSKERDRVRRHIGR